MKKLLSIVLFVCSLSASATTYTVTATHLTMHAGDPVPPLVFYTSSYPGPYSSVFNGQPTLSSTVTPASPVGTYPISIAAGTMSPARGTDSLILVPGTISVIAPDANGAQLTASGITYPAGFFSGPSYAAVNVTSNNIANLDNSCTLDDTAGLNALLKGSRAAGTSGSYWRENIYLYFPPGCYRITGQLQSYGNTWSIYGSGSQSTVIRLDPNSPLFNTGVETPVFQYGNVQANQNPQTFIYNIGFEIAPGNPNAEVIQWVNNNVGEINNVQIWADDSGCAEGLGLHNAYAGPTMIRNLAIYGCVDGVKTGQSEYSATFDGLTTEGQTGYGVYQAGLKLSVQHWLSDNRGTAWYQTGSLSNAAVIDSELFFSGTATTPGIVNTNLATFYARDIASTGYNPTEADSFTGTVVNRSGSLTENWSGAAQTLFDGGVAPGSLHLPEAETPTPSVGPPSTWTQLGTNPSTWCATITNSSNSAVYLPPGVYSATANFSCSIPDSVNLIELYGSAFNPQSASTTLTFTVSGSSTTPLVIDGCYDHCNLIHNGTRSVSVTNSNIGYQDNPAVTHTVFFEDDQIFPLSGSATADCTGNGPIFGPGTTVYGRQFDDEAGSEADTACWKFTANGAKMWLLGYKTERDSPSAILTNQAQVEIFGFFYYQLVLDPPPSNSAPMYLTDSSLFATGYMQNLLNNGGEPNWITETESSQTLSLTTPNLNSSQTLSMFYSYGATPTAGGPPGLYPLTLSTLPEAAGTIQANPASDSGFYEPGTVVTLTATPKSASLFSGWLGNVTSANSAQTTITMTGPESVSANFVSSSSGSSGGSSNPVNVGSSGPVQTLTYTFTGNVTLSAVNILTLGVQGTEYSDGGSSTCTEGTAYTVGQTCTITVAFTPLAPGLRPGAVTLFSASNTMPLATFYLNGIGHAAAITIDPGTETNIGILANSGLGSAVAVDAAGNIYVADQVNSQVLKLAAGTYIPTPIVTSGLLHPTALALDGAGNLYISDSGNKRVVMVPNEQGTLNLADLFRSRYKRPGSASRHRPGWRWKSICR